jgi:hypothetical protein
MGENMKSFPVDQVVKDDKVLRETRWLGAFVIPFLIAASAILLVWPDQTAQLFAWPIKPSMTAMMLGSAYMGGIYFFGRVVFAGQWHTVKAGFLPVATFAGLLGIATLLHWDRFTHTHISFFAWAGLYFTTPFLVLAVWLRNRQTDPRVLAAGEQTLMEPARWAMGILGLVTLVIGLLLFLLPNLLIAVWPWALTPLTARVVGAMFSLPGVVGLAIATDRRWSAARVILEAQAFSIFLILVSTARSWGDLNKANPLAFIFVIGLSAILIGIIALHLGMESKRRIGAYSKE